MSDYKKYINALRKCAKEHEKDFTGTGCIRASDLCNDTAVLLESLEKEEEAIRCNDCKHRPKVIEGYVEIDGFSLEFPDFECPCRCDDPYYNWMPRDDWHCGNGEKKE